jgi:LuxR family maltose regulon positive regulatory protein
MAVVRRRDLMPSMNRTWIRLSRERRPFLAGPSASANAVGRSSESRHDHLEAERLLIPLGRGWYRYHHLFADLLRSRLVGSKPTRLESLLAKAAKTCEKRGLIDDSVASALEADDVGLAGGIVERNIAPALGAGRSLVSDRG